MKEIIDVIVLALFVFMIFMFLKGFNQQQIKKHTDKLEAIEKKNADKEKIDE